MRSIVANLRSRLLPRRDARGFTLVELLITLTVLVIVMSAVAAMVYLSSKSKTASAQRIESIQGARVALDRLANDLRSAGYNADLTYSTPQPPIAYIDSTQVLINADLQPFPDTVATNLGSNPNSTPRAYDPVGSPRPFPLDGTTWQPPIKYRTGAEVIRYTLDANNDGLIDSNDLTGNGALAARTANPNDYVLLRQVYGDSANGSTAGDNDYSTEQIALVRKPGGSVPPMFTVYMKGSPTPWNWASGPVPANQLNNIERVTVKVDAASSNHDAKGNYAETILSTDVSSLRNTPNFGSTQYSVYGYVKQDVNANNVLDLGDTGISNVRVTLGNYSSYTDANGYFLFRVFAGTYTLREVVPVGFHIITSPDSFVLNVNTATTRSFLDGANPGGHVDVQVYQDLNDNHVLDAGEPGVAGIPVKLLPDSSTGITDASGMVSALFASPGTYNVSVTLPDTFIVNSTPYPVTGSMTNGGTASVSIGLKKANTGIISGKVFNDNNRDGVLQAGEAGIQNVWVGVTNNGGTNILGYSYTDASGNYSIQVPINDPPHTTAYSVYCIPPAGKFPTSSTSIGGLWVQTSANLANNNFGVAGYSIISLNASRVLSLTTTDLIEKDWNGNATQNAHGDTDLILGADAGGTDNISVWFNQYNDTPLFASAPADPYGYTRLAPQSVMSLAADTLDSDPVWKRRPDLVTGTKLAASGNFFVWLNQNTSGNYGYFPNTPTLSYRTSDAGDVQAVRTLDCAGGSMPDIIVGTKSPTPGTGTIEVWQNNDAVSPTFSQSEVYPNAGSIPGGKLGEVNAMILVDLDGDGRKDLVVGTKTGVTSGEIVVFQNVSKTPGSRFVCRADISTSSDVITALAALDVDGDGRKDIVAGTQTATGGNLMLWKNVDTSGSSWTFTNTMTVAAQGLVMSLAAADFGGSSRPDLAVGWRASSSSYVGGIDIYFTDVLGLPIAGTDPSAGSIANMVPALATGNFNYGTNPTASPPFLTDLAAGVKISATTGALVVFIR